MKQQVLQKFHKYISISVHQILSQLNPQHARKPSRMAEQYFTPVTFSKYHPVWIPALLMKFSLCYQSIHIRVRTDVNITSINVEIITFTITQSQICLHKQHVQVIQPSSGTLQPTKYNSRISTEGYDIINHNTGRSSLMPGLHSCKTLCKWNTQFPFKTKYFWGLANWPHHIYTVWLYR